MGMDSVYPSKENPGQYTTNISGLVGGGAATVKVNDLTGLGDYATSVTNFSAAFSEASAGAYRTFNVKTEGAEGDAVAQFLIKLNSLQEQVFLKFPTSLGNYASTVSTYADSLTGLGFDTRVWSSSEGAESVKSVLVGTQYDQITGVIDNLQTAFNTAANAMGTDPVSLSSYKSTLAEDTSALGKARTDMDSSIQGIYSTFTSNLSSNVQEVTAYQTILNSLNYMLSIPLDVMVGYIKSGSLSADDMNYLDAFRNGDDVTAFKALMSDDPGTIMDGNVEGISQDMYSVIYAEMGDWTEEAWAEANRTGQDASSAKFNSWLNKLGETDASKVETFLGNMLDAGTRAGLATEANMYAIYESNGHSMQDDRLVAYNGDLQRINNLNGIFQNLFLISDKNSGTTVGATDDVNMTLNNDLRNVKVDVNYDLGLKFRSNKDFVLTVATNYVYAGEEYKGEKVSYLNTIESGTGASISRDQARITQLKERQQKQIQSFISDAALTLATAVVPGGSAAKSLISGAYVSAASELMKDSNKYKEIVKTVGDLHSSAVGATSNFSETAGDIKDATKDVTSAITGESTWVSTRQDTDDTYASSDYTFSFETDVRTNEMDTNGLKGYIAQYYTGQTNPETVMKNNNISQDVRDYVLGDSNLTLSEMTSDQLNELSQAIRLFSPDQEGVDQYTTYMNDIYTISGSGG